ncbi:MAG: hypothetical protein FWF51_08000 [Chitinivibrionia bacterium]|nr:hypothetical protein [Chitinivibrionia bacterium]
MKIKAIIIFTIFAITSAFSTSTITPASADTAKNTNGQAISTQQNGNNTNATPISGNKNKTNWSKIKDMFM